jgi:trehalose 6-phosphate phosphatase
LEHLLSVWPAIARQIKEAGNILLLTDYDGTLTPIVERPELADLSEDMKILLQFLARQPRFTLGIISGRSMADLKKRVGIGGIIYAGNHGLEIEGPGINFVNPVAEIFKPTLGILRRALDRALKTFSGVIVENKGLSLSVHYRLADKQNTEEIEEVVKRVVNPAEAGGQAKLTYGKMVYEVRPAVPWNKGKVIEHLIRKYSKEGKRIGLLPIYFGDDSTDEDAFNVINSYGSGLSVFIGEPNQSSTARYFLKSPSEVAVILGFIVGAG